MKEMWAEAGDAIRTEAQIIRRLRMLAKNENDEGRKYVQEMERGSRVSRVGCSPNENEAGFFKEWMTSRMEWDSAKGNGEKQYRPLSVAEIAHIMARTEIEIMQWVKNGFPTSFHHDRN